MAENTGCCLGSSCGCRITSFATVRECPVCHKRLRLAGHAQRLEFRLVCNDCSYQSPRLSQEELRELL